MRTFTEKLVMSGFNFFSFNVPNKSQYRRIEIFYVHFILCTIFFSAAFFHGIKSPAEEFLLNFNVTQAKNIALGLLKFKGTGT